ncbi:MAG: hypothetical protein KGZ25_12680, partial [Planctomycetes bacterium]|nr:hypothetical protein [Planctomycetota bacterium]
EGELQPDSRQWYVDRWVRERESDPGDAPTFSDPTKKLCLVLGETGSSVTHAFEKPDTYDLRSRYTHDEQRFDMDVEVEVGELVPELFPAGTGSEEKVPVKLDHMPYELQLLISQYAKTKVYRRWMSTQGTEKHKLTLNRIPNSLWWLADWDKKDGQSRPCTSNYYYTYSGWGKSGGLTFSGNLFNAEAASIWLDDEAVPTKLGRDALPDAVPVFVNSSGQTLRDELKIYGAYGDKRIPTEAADSPVTKTWEITSNPDGLLRGLNSENNNTVTDTDWVSVLFAEEAGLQDEATIKLDVRGPEFTIHRELRLFGFPGMRLSRIQFDWEENSLNDGQDIRIDRDTDVVAPEWREERQEGNQPCAYVRGQRATLKVKLAGRGGGFLEANQKVTIGAEGGGPLGPIEPTEVQICDADGKMVYFQLQCSRPIAAPVQKSSFEWHWYLTKMGDEDCGRVELGRTEHTGYVLLDKPQAPMEDAWAEVLDYSCRWAEGTTTKNKAAGEVTKAIYNSGRFEFTNELGGTYIFGEDPGQRFYLAHFLDRLSGAQGLGKDVHCEDCAWGTVAFSNVLGSSLRVHFLGFTGGTYMWDIDTHKVVLIGKDTWEKQSWRNHKVAWAGSPGSDAGRVYDATLAFDGHGDPTVAPYHEIVPTDYLFYSKESSPSFDDYKEKLVVPADYDLFRPIATGDGYCEQEIECK